MATQATRTIDPAKVADFTERERRLLLERTPRSGEYYERAHGVMPSGVPSSFQAGEPRPVYIERGEGALVWDVDGNEYVDFHNGFGVMCAGHANPKIVAAVRERVAQGTHFAAPTEGSIVVAEELRRRFGLPKWRFTNSGTESTMDAIHLARGLTGRDVILKIEGSYHGHHDTVMVSVRPSIDEAGPPEHPASVPSGAGYPSALTDLTHVVPFNDLPALERILDEHGDTVAGLIVEPAMMNINIVLPEPGYLEGIRALTQERGVQLIFDEVKTGATIGPGGATQRFGVRPDMVALAKATCGGLPGGAIGMTEELAAIIEDGTVHQYGTFNGNPLVMAAAEATLLEVLTDDAYEQLEALNRALLDGCDRLIENYGLPCHTVGMAAKGCVVFSRETIRDYRDYATKVDGDLSVLSWLVHMNHGIFMAPGIDEQWTLSVAQTDEHVRRYLDAFEAFAREVTEG